MSLYLHEVFSFFHFMFIFFTLMVFRKKKYSEIYLWFLFALYTHLFFLFILFHIYISCLIFFSLCPLTSSGIWIVSVSQCKYYYSAKTEFGMILPNNAFFICHVHFHVFACLFIVFIFMELHVCLYWSTVNWAVRLAIKY